MSSPASQVAEPSGEALHLSGELPRGRDVFGPSGGHRTQDEVLAFVQANYSYDSELNLQAARHRLEDSYRSLETARIHRKWGKYATILARVRESHELVDNYSGDVSADQFDADIDYAQDTVAYSRLVYLRGINTADVYGEHRVLSMASDRPSTVMRILLAHAQFMPTPTSVPGMIATGSEATTLPLAQQS